MTKCKNCGFAKGAHELETKCPYGRTWNQKFDCWEYKYHENDLREFEPLEFKPVLSQTVQNRINGIAEAWRNECELYFNSNLQNYFASKGEQPKTELLLTSIYSYFRTAGEPLRVLNFLLQFVKYTQPDKLPLVQLLIDKYISTVIEHINE